MRSGVLFRRSVVSMILSLLIAVSYVIPAFAQTPGPGPAILDLSDMDQSVDPGEDFFRFVNGGWVDNTPVPADWPWYGAMEELIDRTEQDLISLLQGIEIDATAELLSDQEKAALLFQQGTDLETRNALGIEPLLPFIERFEAAASLEELHLLWLEPEMQGFPDLINLDLFPDPADSTMNILWLAGPLLGLPDVTYYSNDDPANASVIEAYLTLVAALLEATGTPAAESEAAADAVFAFESALASHMVTPVEEQDFGVMYNPTTAEELAAQYPMLDWETYLTALGVEGSPTIVNSELELLGVLDGIVRETDLEVIKDYLKVIATLTNYSLLGEDLEEIVFPYVQTLFGVEEQADPAEEVLGVVNGSFGDAVGQLYVAEHFAPASKAQITVLVEHLIEAFGARIDNLTWMTEETKALAHEKIEAMRLQLGYPDTWKTYEDVETGESYFESVTNASLAAYRERMSKAGKPVDPDEWIVNAQEVNAFYNPSANTIIFPAAILQSPFFDPAADDAWNYGAIGAAIGHEITHGFDLTGSQFDATGNFADWWTEEDRTAFQALNDLVAEQYGAIEVLPGLFVDGQFTVTENVADMGGMQAAFDAFQATRANPGSEPLIDEFTPEQRFFIAYATSWRGIEREEALRTLIETDPHAPSAVRAVVPAQNMDAFYEAFDIGSGEAMYLPPEERIVIW